VVYGLHHLYMHTESLNHASKCEYTVKKKKTGYQGFPVKNTVATF